RVKARRSAHRSQASFVAQVSRAWHARVSTPTEGTLRMDEPAQFQEFARLATEQCNPRTFDLDTLEIPELLQRISAEDHTVPVAVAAELPHIARAVELVVASFRRGGRLIYAGAGTSGRLGVLDASECPPTFGSDPKMVQGVMAGGYGALVRSVEGAEDRADEGERAMIERGVGPNDTVIGLAASRRTPFVVGAIGKARELGARTGYVTCTPRAEFALDVDVAICPVVGPAVLMGSTRMKSGTAQKLVLNMITTAPSVSTGKAYE